MNNPWEGPEEALNSLTSCSKVTICLEGRKGPEEGVSVETSSGARMTAPTVPSILFAGDCNCTSKSPGKTR